MSWEDQGRQSHGWFGTGTTDVNTSVAAVTTSIDNAGQTVARLAAQRLPPDRRAEFDAIARVGGAPRILKAIGIWSDASHLPPNKFRKLLVGNTLPRQAADSLQAMGRSMAAAMALAGRDPGGMAAAPPIRRFTQRRTA